MWAVPTPLSPHKKKMIFLNDEAEVTGARETGTSLVRPANESLKKSSNDDDDDDDD